MSNNNNDIIWDEDSEIVWDDKPSSTTVAALDKQEKQPFFRRAARTAATYARPALEMGGMLAGGVLGTPAAPGLGTLAGAGLGYAGGRQIANLFEQAGGVRQPQGIGREMLGVGRDVAMGGAMEAGGALIGLPLQKGLQAVSRAAPRIWESVAKIPPRSVPKHVREKAVKTAFEYKIPATQKGFQKLRGMINETNDKIASVIDDVGNFGKDIKKIKPPIPKEAKPFVSWSKNVDPVFNELGDEIGEDAYALIDLVYVPKALRGKGIAKRMLADEIKKIKKTGLPIKLNALPKEKEVDLHKLVKFYEEMGFSVAEEQAGTGIIMELTGKTPSFAPLKTVGKSISGNMVKISDILKRLDDVKTWAKKSYPDPTPVYKMVDAYKKGIGKTRGAEISIAEAQKLKQGIYRRLTDAAYGEYSTPAKEMDKAFARGLKEKIVEKFPILQKLNAKDSALISLQDILERTVNRTRNWDIVGLSDLAGSGVGAVAGTVEGGGDLRRGGFGALGGLMLARGLRSPAIMSQLAFALNKAGKIIAPRMAPRLAAYGVGKASGTTEIPAEEIIGSALDAVTPSAEAGMAPEIEETRERGIKISPAVDLERSATQLALDAWDNLSPQQYNQAIDLFKRAMKIDPSKIRKYQIAINTLKKEKNAIMDFKRRHGYELRTMGADSGNTNIRAQGEMNHAN